MYVLLVLLALITPTATSAMKFEVSGTGGNCNGCEWIAGEGTIDQTSVPNLLAALKSMDGGYPGLRIELNSPGGSLTSGIMLGHLIRERKLSTSVGRTISDPNSSASKTTVPGKCASACAFAFLGGVIRDTAGGDVGVHQFYQDIALKDPSAKVFDALDLSRQQMVSAMLIDYVHRMGVDPRFVSVASNVAPTQMHWLTADEVKDMKVAYRPEAFEAWKIEPWGNGLVAVSQTQDKSKTATLFCGKDRAPKLRLDWPTHLAVTDFSNAFSHSEIVQVQSVEIPVGTTKLSVQNQRATLTIEVKSAATAITGSKSSNLSIALDESKGRYLAGYIPFQIEGAGLQRAARLAFRNCV